ncbi:MAG: sugar phosphate nucleotidyltransferase [Patescibacteria group bacterium]
MYAVIMAGGSGTRLWPMSREQRPKQLHKLISNKTLLQETYERIIKAVPEKNVYVSTIRKFIDEAKKQLPDLPDDHFIVEPAPKNTAPAFAYICKYLLKKDPDASIATIASDHLIKNTDAFVETIKIGKKVLEKHPHHLTAVGINPNFPSTELGYMKIGKEISRIDGRQVFEIEEFTEKPDLKTAYQYVQGWNYLWNGAYYFFKAKEMLNWIGEFRPEIIRTIDMISDIENSDSPMAETKINDLYSKLDSEQIENAIIEDTGFKKFLSIPADLGWSDIGTWSTLCDVLLSNYSAHIISRGNHIDIDSKNSLIYANNKLIATIGLEDLIVVDTDDIMFIANKNKANDVKKLLTKLKAEGKHPYL